MALPLEPDVAEEDVVPPFISAPEVRALAFDVMSQWEEFAGLRDALGREEEPLRIAFVFETKPYVEGELVKTHTIAKVTKAAPMWAFLGEVDLVIQFRQPFWEHFDERQRRAVLHHEMSHIEFPRGRLGLREHDVEDFVWTMRRYGPYLPGRRAFVRAAEIWLEENPEPPSDLDEARARRPRPGPGGGSDEAVAQAALDFRRSIEAGDVDVTVTAGGRSTTIKGRGKPTALPGERLAKADGTDAPGGPVH
jgi:hypothetical protein